MIATIFDLNWWMAVTSILVSVGSIIFFLKKAIVKAVAQDIQALDNKVSPNGKNTQNIGDIAARTEDAIHELKSNINILVADGKKTKEMLIEHIGWHKGQRDAHNNL